MTTRLMELILLANDDPKYISDIKQMFKQDSVLVHAKMSNIEAQLFGDTCLTAACKFSNLKLVQLALKYDSSTKFRTDKYESAMRLAIGPDEINFDIVVSLIDSGADPNEVDCYGTTVSMYAIIHDNIKIFKYLINAGADIDDCDNMYNNVLMAASSYTDCSDFTEFLINAFADISAVNIDGDNALMWAVFNPRTVKLLLNAGADPNCVNLKDQTALMIACKNTNNETIDILLRSGTKTNIWDKKGMTALLYYLKCSITCDEDTLMKLVTCSDVSITCYKNKCAYDYYLERLSKQDIIVLSDRSIKLLKGSIKMINVKRAKY